MNKKILVLIISILVIVIVGVLVWVFWPKDMGWKTYTNDNYGYEIQYPSNFNVLRAGDTTIFSGEVLASRYQESNTEESIKLLVLEEYTSLDDWTSLQSSNDYDYPAGGLTMVTDKEINGILFREVKICDSGCSVKLGTVLPNNAGILSIELFIEGLLYYDAEGIFNNMLSTFKFINN
jgi:hypothetical protein